MGGRSADDRFLELPWKAGGAQDLLRDCLPSCFVNARSRDDATEDFCPLRQANAELKAEHSSLLLKNSELLSQTLLLKLENKQLKRQLELQLQKQQSNASCFSAASSSVEESFTDSDMEDEGKLPRTSSDGTSSEDTDTTFSP